MIFYFLGYGGVGIYFMWKLLVRPLLRVLLWLTWWSIKLTWWYFISPFLIARWVWRKIQTQT